MKYKVPMCVGCTLIALLLFSLVPSIGDNTRDPLYAPTEGHTNTYTPIKHRSSDAIGDTRIFGEDALIYSTYFSGSSGDAGQSIVLDANGYIYIAGYTTSTDLPTTFGAFDESYSGGANDGFVAKFTPNGTNLVYCTYMGGSEKDFINEMVLNATGNVYITGYTTSSDYPTTTGAYDETYNGALDNAFLSILSTNGSLLLYSTYIGGADNRDIANALILDSSMDVYIAGETLSDDFPVPNGFDQSFGLGWAGFALKLSPDSAGGADMIYGTYLTGDGVGDNSKALSIEVNSSGMAFVAGYTTDSTFPTILNSYNTTHGGYTSPFIVVISANGGTQLYGTFFGGGETGGADTITSMDLDDNNKLYVAGYTRCPTFPTTTGAFDETHNGNWDGFVGKFQLNLGGSNDLVYSTLIGGGGSDYVNDILADSGGNVYIIGSTGSSNFPMVNGSYNTTYGVSDDIFLTVFNPILSKLYNSTYIGSGYNENGNSITISVNKTIYFTGCTQGPMFPVTLDAYNDTAGGSNDAIFGILSGPLTAEINFQILNTFSSLDLSELFIINVNITVPTYAYYDLDAVTITFGGSIYDMTNTTTPEQWNWTWNGVMNTSGVIGYYIYAEIDNSGYNRSADYSVTVGYPPSISSIDPSTGDRDNMTQGRQLVVTATVTDSRTGDSGVSAVSIYFDDEYYAMTSGSSTYTFKKTLNKTGTYEWRIRALDNAGNYAYSDWYEVLVEEYEGTSGDADKPSTSAAKKKAQELEAETGVWSIALIAIVAGLVILTLLLKSRALGYLPGMGIALGLLAGLLLVGPWGYWETALIGLYMLPWLYYTHKKGLKGAFMGLTGAFAILTVYSVIFNGIESLATWAFISMLAGSVGATLLPGKWRFPAVIGGLVLGIVFLVLL